VVWQQLQINKITLLLFRIIGELAIPMFLTHAYVDYKIFIVFGADLHAFTTFTIHNMPFYIFCLGLLIASIKKFFNFLWFSPIFAFLVFRADGVYLYKLILNPDMITISALTYLSNFTCIFTGLTLTVWLMWLKIFLARKK
jgi:hypothetical protein